MKRFAATAMSVLFLGLGAQVQAQNADAGQDAFERYCATCHGIGGTGDGPMTELMTAKVPDLTGLAARNEGVFPMLEVIHVIDGRTGLRAHGGPMPVFGAVFQHEMEGAGPYGDVIYARGKVLSLAYYLETIQK